MTSFADRDSARWNMDSITVQKRRNLFWEVFSADVSHVSLTIGVSKEMRVTLNCLEVESGFGTATCNSSFICRLRVSLRR